MQQDSETTIARRIVQLATLTSDASSGGLMRLWSLVPLLLARTDLQEPRIALWRGRVPSDWRALIEACDFRLEESDAVDRNLDAVVGARHVSLVGLSSVVEAVDIVDFFSRMSATLAERGLLVVDLETIEGAGKTQLQCRAFLRDTAHQFGYAPVDMNLDGIFVARKSESGAAETQSPGSCSSVSCHPAARIMPGTSSGIEPSVSHGREQETFSRELLRAENESLRARIDEVTMHHQHAVADVERLRARLERTKMFGKKWRRPFHFLRELGRRLRRKRKRIDRKVSPAPPVRLEEAAVRDLPPDVANAYRRLIALRPIAGVQNDRVGTSERPRLAYVSPIPPTRSGIADYSAELIVALARHYDIDVVSGHPDEMQSTPAGAARIVDVAVFCREAALYDRVIYHLGNSQYHCYMFPLMERIPGIVVLHDFFLGHVLNYTQRHLQPGAWARSLYHSHGLRACLELARTSAADELAFKYPVNLEFLEFAQGVIVHSAFTRGLAADFYRREFADSWAVVPSLRKLPEAVDASAIRARLGFSEKDFVVCSFGMLGRTKKNQTLLRAWNMSLAAETNCHLVFVGELAPDAFGRSLRGEIVESAARDRIRITGFVDKDTYQSLLAIADVAVQLREQSRGETSAAVRDCMGHGIATIVNAHATMADLPNGAVMMLPDVFSDERLATALRELHDDAALRQRLGQEARRYIAQVCAPDDVASLYGDAIETFAGTALPIRRLDRLTAMAADLPEETSHPDWLRAAAEISDASKSPGGLRQIFVDVSVVSREDYGTGIQRVVRAQLLGLIARQPVGTRIEPVRLVRMGDTWVYKYARGYVCSVLGIENDLGEDDPIAAQPGDILLVSDLDQHTFSAAASDGYFALLRSSGVGIHVIVYDILPILRPEFFPPGADEAHRSWLLAAARWSNQLICISRTVAQEVEQWLARNLPGEAPAIDWIHLGADLNAARSPEIRKGKISKSLDEATTFLMVGTLEPRKGHLQAIAAFDELWTKGIKANLVFVGREGWTSLDASSRRTIPQLVNAIRRHPLFGRRLFWFSDADDAMLDALYRRSACLLIPSEGEGFGLPLVEGAQHGLPIIARRLAVFQEIGGPHACYFDGLSGAHLASVIENWLESFARGEHIRSEGLKWCSWNESVGMLLSTIMKPTFEDVSNPA